MVRLWRIVTQWPSQWWLLVWLLSALLPHHRRPLSNFEYDTTIYHDDMLGGTDQFVQVIQSWKVKEFESDSSPDRGTGFLGAMLGALGDDSSYCTRLRRIIGSNDVTFSPTLTTNEINEALFLGSNCGSITLLRDRKVTFRVVTPYNESSSVVDSSCFIMIHPDSSWMHDDACICHNMIIIIYNL